MDFGGDFKAVMSLVQSPLATSSGGGSSRWAMLQRRQYTISEDGCDGGCDNGGVYKRLVFTVIVMWSFSSLLVSTCYCFPYLLVGGQAFNRFVVVGTPSGGYRRNLGSGGGSGSLMCGLCWRIC